MSHVPSLGRLVSQVPSNVGANDSGLCVGLCVGFAVGLSVGDCVGEAVGELEDSGSNVGLPVAAWTSKFSPHIRIVDAVSRNADLVAEWR